MPGESHGQRSLEGYSPRSHKESDTTEHMPIILGDTLFKNIFDWIKVKYDFFFLLSTHNVNFLSFFIFYFLFKIPFPGKWLGFLTEGMEIFSSVFPRS